MSQPLTVGLPVDLEIGPDYILQVTAVDATTGNLVAGANVGIVVITATVLEGGVSAGGDLGEWLLVPGPDA